MHFHLPKPLHGWREFAGEVGIIVIGVLIALGAEQVMERFHQRAELRDAEAAMTSELRDDDLPQAFTRAAIYNCYNDQLNAIENAVASGDREQVLLLAKAYKPVVRTWDDEAWKSALASQVLAHSGSKRMLSWSTAYVMIPALRKDAEAEQDELPHLRSNLSGTSALSPGQQDRLFDTLSIIRRDNRAVSGESLILIKFAGDIDLKLSKAQKDALLSDARKKFGSCVSQPSPERMNLQTQLPTAADAPFRSN
jgi:hypothetical protein